MTENTWKILKLDWKTPGFFSSKEWEPCLSHPPRSKLPLLQSSSQLKSVTAHRPQPITAHSVQIKLDTLAFMDSDRCTHIGSTFDNCMTLTFYPYLRVNAWHSCYKICRNRW